MLQWQLHQAVKATLTSKVNLKDVPNGKVNSVPLGLNFEVKYWEKIFSRTETMSHHEFFLQNVFKNGF